MSGELPEREHLEFLQGLMKRGFVNIPRLLFDYVGDLKMDYDTLGKLFTVLSYVGGPSESAFDTYILTRSTRDFDQIRGLIRDLEAEDLIKSDVIQDEHDGEQIHFSFSPLFFRLQSIWKEHLEKHEQDRARKVHPAIKVAEAILAKAFNKKEMEDILDWVQTYNFSTEIIALICREGKSKGVLRQSYLNEIARSWYEAGVRTPEQAEAHLERLHKSASKNRVLIRELNLGRNLTGPELALLEKWSAEWGFSNEVILRAAAVAAGTKAPLQYMNAVLEGWKGQGVRTLADAEQVLIEYKRRPPVAQSQAGARSRKTSGPKNVIHQSERKDDSYFGYVNKKLGK